ncbi:MAG: tetratricopeptide repeat protein [Luteimonas sp.]
MGHSGYDIGLPAATEITAQLQRVLNSAAFANAPVLSRFLRHVVEHRLRGDGSSLKEYTLGVEVFDRGDAFDPRIDTIVRTHARRLRAKLDEYYRGPGRSDPVLIEIPKGHYCPDIRVAPDRAEPPVVVTAAARSPSNLMMRLPAPRTSLIGRAEALAEMRHLLVERDARLVTITGAGGSGKTRLALAAAWESGSDFSGGVIFVSLAAAADAETLMDTIAKALGVRQVGGRPLGTALAEHLQREFTSPTLLVLDNFEQIVSAAPMVGELLDACAMLKVLATSRVALRLYGEHEYPLAPLPVPQRDPLPPLDELARNPAVSLFLQRAAAAGAACTLATENAQAIADLCCRLDGLPLSIELVAARAGSLTPAAMLARFRGHLDLPEHAACDAPERQRTLRRTMDWSHELLDEAERALFRRLSVFAGGFTLEAAEAVGDTRGDLPGGIDAVVEGLVTKSLLLPLRDNVEPRYTMLESIREYGLERLAASSEEEAVRRAHAAYCLVLAEEGNARLSAVQREAWLARCDLDHDNFRVAIDGLLRRGEIGWATRMGLGLFGYWERREHVAEGRRRLQAILDRCQPDADPVTWTKLAVYLATLIAQQGHDPHAEALYARALAVCRSTGNHKGVAACLTSLGANAQLRGDYVAARDWFEQAVVACRSLRDAPEIAAALSNLAGLETIAGEPDRARALLEESLTLFRAGDDPVPVAWCLNHLADMASDAGDSAEAERLYREAEMLFRQRGDLWGIARSRTDLGFLALQQGDTAGAGVHLADALGLFLQLRHRRGVATLLEACACLAAQQAKAEQALILAGAASTTRELIGFPRRASQAAKLDHALAPIWRDTEPAAARGHWERGAQMPFEEVVGYALETVRPADE